MPSKVFLNQIVEGTSVISSDMLCTAALTHLQETKTGANMRWTGMNRRTETLSQENKSPSDVPEKEENREWVKAETVMKKSNIREKPMLTKANSYTLAMKKSGLWRVPWEQQEGGKASQREQHQKNNRLPRGQRSSEQKSPRLVLKWRLTKLWKDLYGVLVYHSRIMDSVTQQIPLIPAVI